MDGADIREFDPRELRRHFGFVLQDPYLFTGTIEDNIRLGTEGITNEELEAAAEQVNLLGVHPLAAGRIHSGSARARQRASPPGRSS